MPRAIRTATGKERSAMAETSKSRKVEKSKRRNPSRGVHAARDPYRD
jgi:hypothetical protein